jgi:hypothetical protein
MSKNLSKVSSKEDTIDLCSNKVLINKEEKKNILLYGQQPSGKVNFFLPNIIFDNEAIRHNDYGIDDDSEINYYNELPILKFSDNDNYMECTENNIRTDYLKYIIDNKEKFGSIIKKKNHGLKNDFDYDPFDLAENYLNKSRNGSTKVSYKQNNGIGRYFAVKSLSLQSLKKEIRQTIAENYIDLDIENCHPCILKFICEQNNWECSMIKNYCKDRAGFIFNNGFTKEQGKQLFLIIMNGGDVKLNETAGSFKGFQLEIIKIHKKIAKKHPVEFENFKSKRIKDGKDDNHKAAFMNVILCDIENLLLQTMYDFFGREKSAALCFDGIMLPKEYEYNLNECQKEIRKKWHIDIKLVQKPFSVKFDMSSFIIPKYIEPSLNYLDDYLNIANKDVHLEVALEWMRNSIFYIINGGKGFFLTKNKSEDAVTKQSRIYYTKVKKEELIDTIASDCNIINPRFDYEYWQEHRNNTKEIDLVKFNKYLFTNLSKDHSKKETSLLSYFFFKEKMNNYNCVDFVPFLEKKGIPIIKAYNIFSGFPMEKFNLNDYKDCKDVNFEGSSFYKHIRDEWMNGNEDEFNHFLDFVADIIQDPINIKTVSHMIYTKQGNGKGALSEFLSKLIGRDYVISFVNTEAYFCNFNVNNSNKLIKIFEEVSDKGAAFKNHDRLKGEQSMPYERIEPKGYDAYEIRHCARFVYFTNNENALYVEADCRRFTCHKSNNKHANDLVYFRPIWDEIRNWKYIKSAFEFFANRKYQYESVITCYNNVFKREQKVINFCTTHKFLLQLGKDNFEETISNGDNEYQQKLDFLTDDKIKITVLSNAFKRWCDKTYSKGIYNLNTFKTQIKKLDIEENEGKISKSLNPEYNNTKQRYYILNTDILKQKFRKFLSDDTFEY